MFKGQVPIGNGCGPWTGHTNISWHLTPSSLPLFISSHLISSHFILISSHHIAASGTWTLLPHPTPAVTDQPRGLVCLCVHRNMNVITPPYPTGNWSAKSSACVCRTARKMIRLLCLCVHRNMNFISPPHPTPSPDSSVCTDEPDMRVQMNPKCVYRWTGSVCTDDPDLCAQMTLHPEKGGEGVSYIDFDAHGVVLGNLTK